MIDNVVISSRITTAQGILAALAFSVLLAGSNAATPLLPLYRGLLSFSPLMLTMTYVSYVSVLLAMLLLFSKPALVRLAPATLCCALLVAVLADGLLATASEAGIFVGRALTGMSVGMGTGSASALVVAAMGARGRSVSATGNLIGAIMGTVLAQLFVVYSAHTALQRTFLFHIGLCLAVLLLLAPTLYARKFANGELLALAHVPEIDDDIAQAFRRKRTVVAVACVSWMLLSLSCLLLPSYFAEIGMRFAGSYGIIVLLTCSALAQLLSTRLRAFFPWASGMVMATFGPMLMFFGAHAGASAVALLGFAMTGAGTGLAYRLALVVIAKGAPPARQGPIASLYAAITYGFAACSGLGSGLIGNLLGFETTVVTVFLLLVLASFMLVRGAPRLRDAEH